MSEDELKQGQLTIQADVEIEDGSRLNMPPILIQDIKDQTENLDVLETMTLKESVEEFLTTGVHSFKLDVPDRAKIITLNALFTHPHLGTAKKTARSYAFQSELEDKHIKVILQI